MNKNVRKRKPVSFFIEEGVIQQEKNKKAIQGFFGPTIKNRKRVKEHKIPKTKKNLDMSYRQAHDTYGLPPMGNYDNDYYNNGMPVVNGIDCKPFDPLRQGVHWDRIKGFVGNVGRVADDITSDVIEGGRKINRSKTARAIRSGHKKRVEEYNENLDYSTSLFGKRKKEYPDLRFHPPERAGTTIRITQNVEKERAYPDFPSEEMYPLGDPRPYEYPTDKEPIHFAENRRTGGIVYPIRGPLNPVVFNVMTLPKDQFKQLMKKKGIKI